MLCQLLAWHMAYLIMDGAAGMSQMSSQLTAESKQYANRARDLARQVRRDLPQTSNMCVQISRTCCLPYVLINTVVS